MSNIPIQFREIYSVHIDYGSIIYDDHNFVKLHKGETFHIDPGFVFTFFKTYLFSMVIGSISAVFLFSFLPHMLNVIIQGYQTHIVFDFAVQNTIDDFMLRPSAVLEIPKAWLVPLAGVIYSALLRKFYVYE